MPDSPPRRWTGSYRTRRTRESSTQRRRSSAFRPKKSWSRSTATRTRPRPPFRLHSIRPSGMVGSSAATSSSWKRWAADSRGGRRRSGIEKFGIFDDCRIADGALFRYESVLKRRGAPSTREIIMADLGIARINNDMDTNGTVTRADLADVVHRRLGLSRAESAGLVERVLHHMCHALSVGQNVKVSGFGTFILRDKGQRIGRNPKTGIEVPIAPRRVMTFRASQIMRDRIAKG